MGVVLAGLGILAIIVFLVALFIAGLFMYLGAKLAGIEKASIGKGMLAVLAGSILGVIVGFIFGMIPILGMILGPLMAFIAYVWVVKAIFSTGWLKAFIATILAIVIEIVTFFLLGALLGAGLWALAF
ncbi:hypothetical protein [Pyrococcus yayanosii]|nr:hypothetical protein [Pyrococcus yayanosii]